MNLDLLKSNIRKDFPALVLERVLPRRRRNQLRNLFGFLILLSFIWLIISPGRQLLGLELILFVVWLKLCLLEAFYLDSCFRDLGDPSVLADFEAASLIFTLSSTDVTGSFIKSPLGREILLRSGIDLDKELINKFLQSRSRRVALGQCVVDSNRGEAKVGLSEVTRAILRADKDFVDFLFQNSVSENDFAATASWLSRISSRKKHLERWWSREALGRLPGLARNWTYGRAFRLEKYLEPLPPPASSDDYTYNQSEMERIEAALARGREDNVMIIGDDQERKLGLVSLLAKTIEENRALSPLVHKEIALINAAAFSANNAEKSQFESEFIKMMNDAAHAGNLVVVFPEFTALARSAQVVGSDLDALLEPYLVSPDLQIIALVTAGEFHQVWERRAELMNRFEKILLGDIYGEEVIRALEDESIKLESVGGVTFTRPALAAIALGADRYFPGGTMPDAALDLAYDLATKKPRQLITKSDVDALVKEKTGIPLGEITGDERSKLANLEKILHERIIGQDEAIKGVANALRRSRAGTSNPNRPIGSFLFLGPTGVGKTETTKALARAYFGDESKINRLDMSEYSSPDAPDKLIGSFSTGTTGVLSTMMREQSYGILLLDEFEKATSKIHNLFLQVLDEGFFSDMGGKRISVRNHMIIATSNAGSDLIWEVLKSGKNLLEEKNNIVDELIKQGIFRPELLNRFDGVILFHALSREDLRKVAKILLAKLSERLKARGTKIEITDDLLDYLVEQGTDPKFGARSMNRAIQDHVEQAVANKIVLEALRPGQTVTLSKTDVLGV